jgi:hypothetical protein
MKRIFAPMLLASLLAVPAFAGSDVTEIRLGKEPPPPPRVDPAKVHAVTRFLGARQAASLDASRRGEARRLITPGAGADEATLVGAKGTRIIAFDFKDEALEPLGGGRFEVPVFILFADRTGSIVESRDERLTFAAQGGDFRCVSLKQINVMAWDKDAIEEEAASMNAKPALDRAEAFLREWAEREPRASGFSVKDLQKTDKGTLLVQCRRFTAEVGRRGYDVIDSPLVLTQSAGEYRVESN